METCYEPDFRRDSLLSPAQVLACVLFLVFSTLRKVQSTAPCQCPSHSLETVYESNAREVWQLQPSNRDADDGGMGFGGLVPFRFGWMCFGAGSVQNASHRDRATVVESGGRTGVGASRLILAGGHGGLPRSERFADRSSAPAYRRTG